MDVYVRVRMYVVFSAYMTVYVCIHVRAYMCVSTRVCVCALSIFMRAYVCGVCIHMCVC